MGLLAFASNLTSSFRRCFSRKFADDRICRLCGADETETQNQLYLKSAEDCAEKQDAETWDYKNLRREMGLAVDELSAAFVWYNMRMPEHYTIKTELSDEEKKLAAAAAAASHEAVQAAFAAGLSITVGKNGKLVEIAPDGTETIIGDL